MLLQRMSKPPPGTRLCRSPHRELEYTILSTLSGSKPFFAFPQEPTTTPLSDWLVPPATPTLSSLPLPQDARYLILLEG
jgi:hypothetical protein